MSEQDFIDDLVLEQFRVTDYMYPGLAIDKLIDNNYIELFRDSYSMDPKIYKPQFFKANDDYAVCQSFVVVNDYHHSKLNFPRRVKFKAGDKLRFVYQPNDLILVAIIVFDQND